MLATCSSKSASRFLFCPSDECGLRTAPLSLAVMHATAQYGRDFTLVHIHFSLLGCLRLYKSLSTHLRQEDLVEDNEQRDAPEPMKGELGIHCRCQRKELRRHHSLSKRAKQKRRQGRDLDITRGNQWLVQLSRARRLHRMTC